MNIANKIVLITGGSRGLGRDMALQIARNGGDVVITYRARADEAQAVCAQVEAIGRKAVALSLDTSVPGSFEAFAGQLQAALKQHWQRDTFDFLVNNAGIDVYSPIGQTTEAQFDSLLNVHFKGVYFLTQTLLPQLADGGGIICISTGLTRFSLPGYAVYASMKGAIEVFVKYLAKELGPRRIRANVVAPGAIDTDFNRAAFDGNPEVVDFIAAQTALGRVGQAHDIGGVVAFLCSEQAAWVNAQRIEASGGMFL